ncbi:MAG TPA: hypothetical protein VFU94_06510 [Conexibacter sp.]|nr:hypothetical protein [Conexibacter sp.]
MADTGNLTVLKQLYSKLAEALTAGTPEAAPGQSYITLSNPGIFIDPRLAPERDVAAQRAWASRLDNVPSANWVYTPTDMSVAHLYDDILRCKELPLSELERAQQALLDRERAVIMDKQGRPTRRIADYRRYQGQYLRALTDYGTAKADMANRGTPVPPETLEALNDAREDWNTFGFKGEVQAAQATVANLEALNPNPWWTELTNRFRNEYEPVGFAPTTTDPGYSRLVGDSGWTRFTFTQEDVVRQGTSSAVSGGGGVSGDWGLWRVSGSADYRRDTRSSSSDTTGISISLDLMRATIVRGWLDPLVFRAHTWRLGRSTRLGGQLIAKGTFLPGEGGGGLMPLLPTGVIVARNVVVKTQLSHQDQTMVDEALRAEASVGWGPFAISGHYNQSSSSDVSHGNVTATGISNPTPQILGFFCDVLPLCPSPLPDLRWPETFEEAVA